MFENCCSAVHVFALPRLRAMVELLPPTRLPSVPVTVSVPFAEANDVVATVCSAPPPTPYIRLPDVNVV